MTWYTYPMSCGRVARWMLEEVGEREILESARSMKAPEYLAIISVGMTFGTIDKRAAFERYWNVLSARPAARRAREIDDKLVAEMRKAS
jgi:hypothetical protein